MSPRSSIVSTLAILFSFVLACGLDAAGAVTSVERSTEQIVWTPLVDHAGLVLTVSTPGGVVLRREFSSGTVPVLGIRDLETVGPLDGPYTWEMTAVPRIDGETRRAMAEARATGDASLIARLKAAGDLPRERLVQSGYFSVVDGRIVRDLPVREGEAEEPGQTGDPPAPTRFVPPRSRTAEARAAGPGPPDAIAAPQDHLIYDDAIITGSLCVGMDCVNGESFGFDTVRLKENNLRLRFQDTSATSAFPSNDWQLTANDSINGGAEKFSIEDIDHGRTPFTIEANAPSHSLYVEDYGRLGLGTSTPAVEAHIKDSDTPTFRLEQDSSGGWSPQTWDLSGNESNFFIRDVTNGSKLVFRIKPGAPANCLYIDPNGRLGLGTDSPEAAWHMENSAAEDRDDVVITQQGNMGLGTSYPAANFHMVSASHAKLRMDGPGGFHVETEYRDGAQLAGRFIAATGNAPGYRYFGFISYKDQDGTPLPIRFFTSDVGGTGRDTLYLGAGQPSGKPGRVGIGVVPDYPLQVGRYGSGSGNGAHVTEGGVWVNASSRLFKEEIAELDVEEAVQALRGLSPVSFRYIAAPGEEHLGFIAEDVPDLVATEDRRSMSPMDVVAVLTRVVQRQEEVIERLAKRVEALEGVSGAHREPRDPRLSRPSAF